MTPVVAPRAVIALTPPIVDEALADVRRRFDPQFDVVPSHLTLVFPHRVGFEVLDGHVKDVAAFHRPIRVRLAGFAGGDEASLYARVTEGNDELIALHDDLYTGVLAPALDRTSLFVPHVTVGVFESMAALRAALDESDHEVSWEFDLRELVIYRLRGDQPGEIEAGIPLADARC
jgi:2'-5' RNA ligase